MEAIPKIRQLRGIRRWSLKLFVIEVDE
jgi:hypothetical protein